MLSSSDISNTRGAVCNANHITLRAVMAPNAPLVAFIDPPKHYFHLVSYIKH